MFYEEIIDKVVMFLLNMIFGKEKGAKLRHFGVKKISFVLNAVDFVKTRIP